MGLAIDDVNFVEPTALTLQPLQISALSQGVHCLHGWWQDWGPAAHRMAANSYKFQESQHRLNPTYNRMPSPPIFYDKAWAQRRLDTALAAVARGLIIAAFPSFPPYNKNAALLLENGFSLLGDRCYPNANYSFSGYSTGVKGGVYSQDGYPHWLHLWIKDLKGLESCGELTFGLPPAAVMPAGNTPEGQTVPKRPEVMGFPNCCGLRLRWTPDDLKADPYNSGNANRYLSVCQIPSDHKFPSKLGWKRFALYKDFKWGINFESVHVKGVQKCPHVFDLAKIEAWELAQPLPKLF